MGSNSSWISCAAAPLLAAALASPLGAQEAGDSSELFFDTVDVNVVNLEVIVTDSDGEPVTGLTAEDFQVFEDGELVELSNFFAVEGRQTVRSGLTPSTLASGEALPEPETQRLNLIVYVDNFNILPQNRNVVFENLRRYLADGFDPRDLVMLASFDNQVEIVQDFTSDPQQLLSAIDSLEKKGGAQAAFEAQKQALYRQMDNTPLLTDSGGGGGLAGGLADNESDTTELAAVSLAQEIRSLSEQSRQRLRASLAALEGFSSSLAGMRGRKAILYISDGLPLRPADPMVQAWLNSFEGWAFQNGRSDLVRDLQSLGSTEFDFTQDFQDLVAHASAHRVAFYPISRGGHSGAGRVSAEFRGGGDSGLGARSLDVVNLETFGMEGSLLQLADGTGGIAFTRTANVGELMDRMVRDFETFYSLGYRVSERDGDAFHEVRVKVAHEGAQVRHLKGYRQQDPLEKLRSLTLSALRHGVGENTLEVRLDPGEQTKVKGDRYRVAVMVKIPFQKLLLLPEEKSHTGRVTLFVAVEDLDEGGVSSPQRIDLPIQIPNERILEAMSQVAAYPLQLDMKPGPKRVALGVRDDLGQTESTVSVELEVGGGSG